MTITVTIEPGGPTKGSIIKMAWGACGIADYDPDEAVTALELLNAMMLEHPWSALGYEQPDYGAGLSTDESGIPNDAKMAVAYNLAIALAPTKGKTLSPEQRKTAAESKSYVATEYATIPTMQFARSTFRGAGSRGILRGPFLITPDS